MAAYVPKHCSHLTISDMIRLLGLTTCWWASEARCPRLSGRNSAIYIQLPCSIHLRSFVEIGGAATPIWTTLGFLLCWSVEPLSFGDPLSANDGMLIVFPAWEDPRLLNWDICEWFVKDVGDGQSLHRKDYGIWIYMQVLEEGWGITVYL